MSTFIRFFYHRIYTVLFILQCTLLTILAGARTLFSKYPHVITDSSG